MKNIIDLQNVSLADLESVGGKNASTGEMIQNLSNNGIKVPGGFAVTTASYKNFLAQNQLDQQIKILLDKLKINNVTQLNQTSAKIRRLIINTPFLPDFEAEVKEALSKLGAKTVAVRSSATAEDLPHASFAGQQETFLNIKGTKNVLKAIKHVFASLFTSRAIAYRYHHGLLHDKFAMSVGIQPMVRSDKGASGVMFTIDTESGFDKVILINASYGLGEAIVQGQVNPDEFYVYKPTLTEDKFAILIRKLGEKSVKVIYKKASADPKSCIQLIKVPKPDQSRFCLTDKEVHTLARYAVIIEKHYGKRMDIEWAKDGEDGQLYIVQARPETVKSQEQERAIERYILSKKGTVLTQGLSVGHRIGAGTAQIILNPKKINHLKPGDVLVTDMTDPDWEPIMKKASAIVTNRGGRTCHAAIVARELGIPAVVGCGDATKRIKPKMQVTVSCAEDQRGFIYSGKIPFEVKKVKLENLPDIPLNLCINLGNPGKAFSTQFLPNQGVGLARLEFIISSIGIHPNATIKFKSLNKKLQQTILEKTQGYNTPVNFYVEKLREGIATIAAAFYPKQVIFRFSDFKTNEYANLLGGSLFEMSEENPMIGFRGASRYSHPLFQQCFELECKAFKLVREEMGLNNANVMIPFVRTVDELKNVLHLMNEYGLRRGENELKVYMMCEVPSNVILAKEFLQHVDGYSIGSNDLTQLVLGLDRDSSVIASLFDERNAAVKVLLKETIEHCLKEKKYIGICGQAPSDYPEFAAWLMEIGMQNISLNPDSILDTWLLLAKERQVSETVITEDPSELQLATNN